MTAQRVTLLLLIPASLGVVLSVFDGAPEQQVISLRFGAAHGVSAASLRCEAGDFHSGAEWAIDDAQTQVEHVFHGPEGDYHCDIRLKRRGQDRSYTRRLTISGEKVTIPLESEPRNESR